MTEISISADEDSEQPPSLADLLNNFEGEDIDALTGVSLDSSVEKDFSVLANTVEHGVRFGISIGNFNLLALKGYFCEVLIDAPLSHLPNCPEYFAGLANVRGNLVPVYQIDRLLTQQSETSEHRYILVLGKDDDAVGILTSEIPRSYDMSSAHLLDTLPRMPEHLLVAIQKAYLLDGVCWFDFDHESFFGHLLRT